MSRGTYGSPRVHAELRLGRDVRCGRKRVARLMRTAGLQGAFRRRGRRRYPPPPVHDDLVQRRFYADAPDRLWVTDITEHPTREGKVYLAAVLDVYSRRIVGWSIADPPALGARRRRAGDGTLAAQAASRPDRGALRPREPVHVLGVRPSPARGRAARLDGARGLGLRQRDDGVVLRDATARAARPLSLADPRRAGDGDLRVDRGAGTTRAGATARSPTSAPSTTKGGSPPSLTPPDLLTRTVRRTGSSSLGHYLASGSLPSFVLSC